MTDAGRDEAFVEPEDYSVENPVVRINGRSYVLHEGGSLVIGACPEVLSEEMRKRRLERRNGD